VPLTYDKKSIVKILSHINVGIPGQQTALYEALFLVVIGLARAIITKLRAKNLRVLRNNCLDFTRVFKFSLYGK
jgi:hypothetical protein